MGDLSPHFSRSEFDCPHCGALGTISPALLEVLERLRAISGKPLNIVSGWRCPTQNKKVGGITRSQHLSGRAADLARGRFRAREALCAGAVGVGVRGGWVIHVDVTPNRHPFVFDD